LLKRCLVDGSKIHHLPIHPLQINRRKSHTIPHLRHPLFLNARLLRPGQQQKKRRRLYHPLRHTQRRCRATHLFSGALDLQWIRQSWLGRFNGKPRRPRLHSKGGHPRSITMPTHHLRLYLLLASALLPIKSLLLYLYLHQRASTLYLFARRRFLRATPLKRRLSSVNGSGSGERCVPNQQYQMVTKSRRFLWTPNLLVQPLPLNRYNIAHRM
jgi:hypothetical protein